MLPRNPSRKESARGQAALEAALVLMTLLALLISALDFGQVMFFHQALVERVRNAARWASVHAYDGTGEQIRNMVLFNEPTAPDGRSGFLGLTEDNVDVLYSPGTTANPNDERVTVTLRNYRYQFFSPWIAGQFVDRNPITETIPIFYRP